jgi:DNA-binding transcriptional LysR family regulator
MELRHLRYFVAVGEDQHYGRASRRLRVAQPALSRQIQDLEEELGFKLFERLPRGVKLSAAGELFLQDARRILQEVSEAVVRAARVGRGQSGTLRVGFAESILGRRCSRFLPPIPRAAARRSIAASTSGELGTVGSHQIRPFGCWVRQFYAKSRFGIRPH